jgi:ubiquinone/menaquinone biosynthesis C-methylase UbiE
MRTDTAEAYIVNRYRRWQQGANDYDYKHAKGARIAQIISESGGTVPLAVELGVGPGGIAAALAKRGMRVIGMDLSPEALVKASRHCRGEDVRLMRASGFSLPFRNASLDLIYASQVLHLFDSPQRLLIMNEARRVLKPSGRLVFDMKNVSTHALRFFGSTAARRRRNFPSHDEIEDLLHRSGFSNVRRWPGVLPFASSAPVPNVAICRVLAHTTFFVAR